MSDRNTKEAKGHLLPRIDRERMLKQAKDAMQEAQASPSMRKHEVAFGVIKSVAYLRDYIEQLADAVEQRLEAQPFKYVGVFRSGQTYNKGNFVTYGGSMWYCSEETKDAPPGYGWVLAVKRGKDGREAGSE